MSRTKAIFAGLVAGLLAGIVMTTAMLLLAALRVATPLVIIGDRLSVFIPPGPFLSVMGKVGGYNHLKQLGVGSTIAGQLLVAAIGGAIFGLLSRRNPARASAMWTMPIFVLLPIVAFTIALWPVLGTSYVGLPVEAARLVTLVGFALCVFLFERTLVSAFRFLTMRETGRHEYEFTPAIGRRAFVLSAIGIAVAGGGVALARKLYRAATFSYDGTQYKGRIVEPITPNELFYCVTKNIVDPRVNVDLWHLEVNGLVQNRATWRFQDLVGFPAREQQTTLMCISNGLDAGLISNAIWKGIPLRDLLDQAVPFSNAARVRLHGPLRVIVPGYFGEKHVKWLTRIELTHAKAKGFYEAQGWGPDFITPTRSRIDLPDNESRFSISELQQPIEVKGMAYGGDRGISRVELSFDDGKSWRDAEIYYAGGDLAWSLWKSEWRPDAAGDFVVVVRATDGEGDVQEWEEDRSWFSGVTGFHKIAVHVTA